jgi:uncharacterized protein (TIGR02265 family)
MSSEDPWNNRFVYPSLFDGFRKGLGERFTAQTCEKLKAAGLDVEHLPPAIPARDMAKYKEIITLGAWPELPEHERLRLLGLWMIRGWQRGLLGSAATRLLRLLGPKATLSRLDRVFSTTNNFSHARTEFVGEREALIVVNDVEDQPTYWVGIFEAGLEILGLDGAVSVVLHRPGEATFRVSWK